MQKFGALRHEYLKRTEQSRRDMDRTSEHPLEKFARVWQPESVQPLHTNGRAEA